MKKNGEILIETLIFIILNLIFLSILVGFILTKGDNLSLSEERYAKEIALLIDTAKVGDIIELNMEKVISESRKEGYAGQIITISDNIVQVKLSEKGGYSYSFFNSVKVTPLENNGKYGFVVNQ